MVSGFSYGGGQPRCFVFWQEFQKCYIQTNNPAECRPACKEYFDCLHLPQKDYVNPVKQKNNQHIKQEKKEDEHPK